MGKDVHPCRVKTIRIAVSTVTDDHLGSRQHLLDFQLKFDLGITWYRPEWLFMRVSLSSGQPLGYDLIFIEIL